MVHFMFFKRLKVVCCSCFCDILFVITLIGYNMFSVIDVYVFNIKFVFIGYSFSVHFLF